MPTANSSYNNAAAILFASGLAAQQAALSNNLLASLGIPASLLEGDAADETGKMAGLTGFTKPDYGESPLKGAAEVWQKLKAAEAAIPGLNNQAYKAQPQQPVPPWVKNHIPNSPEIVQKWADALAGKPKGPDGKPLTPNTIAEELYPPGHGMQQAHCPNCHRPSKGATTVDAKHLMVRVNPCGCTMTTQMYNAHCLDPIPSTTPGVSPPTQPVTFGEFVQILDQAGTPPAPTPTPTPPAVAPANLDDLLTPPKRRIQRPT